MLAALTIGLTAGLVAAAPAAADSHEPSWQPLPEPRRIVDTRPGASTYDGAQQGTGRVAGVLVVNVAGRAGVPADVTTVALNVTAVEVAGAGYVTVWPCDTAQPETSNLNPQPGGATANLTVSRVAADGTVCVYTSTAAHVLVDVAGTFASAGFMALDRPQRLVDTRGGATVDGRQSGSGRVAAQSTYMVDVAGRAGLAGAGQVALNVTGVGTVGANGFLTVWSCGTAQPATSNVNLRADGTAVANVAFTRVGDDGHVCIYTSAATHLIVDVAGHLGATADTVFFAEPLRVADTRTPGGSNTYDGLNSGAGLRPAGSTMAVTTSGRAQFPAGVTGVIANITVAGPTGTGYVTAYPGGQPTPNASNVNYMAGQTVANAAIVGVSANGTMCLFTHGATHLIVDVVAYFTGPPAPGGDTCTAPPAPTTPPTPPPAGSQSRFGFRGVDGRDYTEMGDRAHCSTLGVGLPEGHELYEGRVRFVHITPTGTLTRWDRIILPLPWTDGQRAHDLRGAQSDVLITWAEGPGYLSELTCTVVPTDPSQH